MTVEKPKPKQLLRPITTGTNSSMDQSQFLAITCNSLKAREKSRAIGFGFASHWLKNWRDSFKPINKRSNRNPLITFDSHLKTALYQRFSCTLLWSRSLFPALDAGCTNFLSRFLISLHPQLWLVNTITLVLTSIGQLSNTSVCQKTFTRRLGMQLNEAL